MLRPCFVPPPPLVTKVAAHFLRAETAYLKGDLGSCQRYLELTASPELQAWGHLISGPYQKQIHQRKTCPNAPQPRPKELRFTPRMPHTALKQEILARDGYFCRFCGLPVIAPNVRKRLCTLFPTLMTWGRTNKEKHTALHVMELVFDHILPHSRGGETTLDNMVVSCNPCNYGRGELLLEEVGIISPFERPFTKKGAGGAQENLHATTEPSLNRWHGLQGFLPF